MGMFCPPIDLLLAALDNSLEPVEPIELLSPAVARCLGGGFAETHLWGSPRNDPERLFLRAGLRKLLR